MEASLTGLSVSTSIQSYRQYPELSGCPVAPMLTGDAQGTISPFVWSSKGRIAPTIMDGYLGGAAATSSKVVYRRL